MTQYSGIFKQRDLWLFCLFYSVTFGGYVGLSSFLPIFFRDQYAVDPITAGYITALAAFVGSGLRPFGGYLADRFNGVPVLSALLIGIAVIYGLASTLPSLTLMAALLMLGMACLGMGNGAVFQLVPQRFIREIGVATGAVGALGGLGGFMLPNLLGSMKQGVNSFGPGFFVLGSFALGAFVALRLLVLVTHEWRFSWQRHEALAAALPAREAPLVAVGAED